MRLPYPTLVYCLCASISPATASRQCFRICTVNDAAHPCLSRRMPGIEYHTLFVHAYNDKEPTEDEDEAIGLKPSDRMQHFDISKVDPDQNKRPSWLASLPPAEPRSQYTVEALIVQYLRLDGVMRRNPGFRATGANAQSTDISDLVQSS